MAEVQVETKEDLSTGNKELSQVYLWTREIDNAWKKEKDWRDEADQNFQIYSDEKDLIDQFGRKAHRYNIFWSNTQTLRPLVFSQLPNTNITRRFLDKDENSRILSEAIERTMSIFLEKDNADQIIAKARDDYLIGGRGLVRVVFDPPEEIKVQREVALGQVEEVEELDLDTKRVRMEYVPWDEFAMSPENLWEDVRWIGFCHKMTREQLTEQFGKKGEDVPLNYSSDTLEEDKEEDNSLFKLAEVWEIWDKQSKRIIFLTKGSDGKILSDEEDTYNLQGFFPIPKPLGSDSDPRCLTPVPLYRMYKSQAEELNIIDSRIRSLVEQCKFTGVYGGKDTDTDNLMNGEDGTFNPVENLTPGIDIKTLIFTKPLNEIITTIAQLNDQKARIIQNIRDITGLSDIVRGTTAASETATAQRIKGDFAISRIQPLQREVELFVRDLVRLQSELILENYSMEEIAVISGLEIVDLQGITAEATATAQQLIAEANPQTEEEAQLLKQNAEQFINNSLEEPLNELKGFAATPEQLEIIDAMMKNDKIRTFNIDIETDSTISVDQNQEKADRTEFVSAISTYSQNLFPLVQAGIITPTAFNEMLLFIARPFKVGRNLEEHLMSQEEENPEPEQPSVEEQLAAAESQRKDQEVQLKAQEVDIKQQLANVKKAEVLQDQVQFEDKLEFEDVNKAADRQAKTFQDVIKARTDRITSTIRESDLV